MNLVSFTYSGPVFVSPRPMISLDAEGEVIFHVDPDPLVARAQITALKDKLLEHPDALIEMPVEHILLDGMYIRKLHIAKGDLIVGKIHLKACVNIVAKGDISVMTETGSLRVQAGFTLISPPGLQKVGYAHEDTIFINVFRTDETDISKIEAEIASESRNDLASLEFYKMGALCQYCG